MIFTASDVGSLSRSLGRWEAAEYACAALVALACAGEYVADFTDWFTCGVRESKERLAKRSTLLLIAALAPELVCLVKTNSLSGMLIGSLSDKARAADSKAQSAIDKSSLAENKASVAAVAASNAGIAAVKAQEKVEAVAKRAEEVDRGLAQTQFLLSARSVQNRDVLANKVKQQFKGRDVVLRSYIGDQEGWGLCTQLWYVAHSAEMNPVNECGMGQLTVPLTSPLAISGPDIDGTMKLADLLNRIGGVGGWSAIKAPVLTIFVGVKSPFMIGQARPVEAPAKKQTKKQTAKP